MNVSETWARITETERPRNRKRLSVAMPRTGGVRQELPVPWRGDTRKCEHGGHRTVILCKVLIRRSGGVVQRCSADDQDRHLDFALGAARACPEGAAADS